MLSGCNSVEQKNTEDTDFSKDKAEELADVLNSRDSTNKSIIEESTLNSKSPYSDSIWKIVTREITNCSNPKVKNIRNKKLSYCDQGKGIELFELEYVENNIVITEKYLTQNSQLIYAIEWEKRTADLSDENATYWNCEYIVKDNYVVDHISLGMGKTEGDSFDVQDIVKLWNSRKKEFFKLKEKL